MIINEGRTKRCQLDGKHYKTAQITKQGVTKHCMKKGSHWVDRNQNKVTGA